jgi:DTW domain-containing protein
MPPGFGGCIARRRAPYLTLVRGGHPNGSGPDPERAMTCPHCGKPVQVCVCDRITPIAVSTPVVVLQHPQEQDRVLGTVPLLERAIGARRRIGLSWPNLAGALGEEPVGPWAVIWPTQLPRPLEPAEQSAPFIRIGPPERPPVGLIVLDGSWSQAKALWWRNPWLLKLDRIVLHPSEPSIYGRLRREPRPQWISTLEAVGDALVGLGEPEEVRTTLRRAMRTMVQRARDAAVIERNGR